MTSTSINDKLFISLKSKILNKKLNFFLNDASFEKMTKPLKIYKASILPEDYGSHIFAFYNDPNISLHCSWLITKESQTYLNMPWYSLIFCRDSHQTIWLLVVIFLSWFMVLMKVPILWILLKFDSLYNKNKLKKMWWILLL